MEPEQRDVIGERATGESGARASCDEWRARLGESPHDGDEFLARAREHREGRAPRESRQPVRAVDDERGRSCEHVLGADEARECRGERGHGREAIGPTGVTR